MLIAVVQGRIPGFLAKGVRFSQPRQLISDSTNGPIKRCERCFRGEIGKQMRTFLMSALIVRFWGGRMTEEQATEEGRLEFVRAKYFGRDMGVPELVRYADVKTPLDPSMEAIFSLDEADAGKGESGITKTHGKLSLKQSLNVESAVKAKRVTVRKVSVSSSESDVDIGEVLKEVVKDYTATHSRSTRPAGRPFRTHENKERDDQGKDLISLD